MREKLKKAYESLEKRYPILKKIKEYIKKILYNKSFHIGILIIGLPFLFIILTRFLFDVLPGRKIATESDWINFSGSYLGVISAVGAVWWQMRKEENDEIKGLLYYIKDILEYNKENYTLDYMDRINYQASSMTWIKYKDYSEINLKDLNLSKTDKLLLYKHNYRNLIKLNDKIKNIINSYYFTPKEENIFYEIENFVKNIEKDDFLKAELKKIFLMLLPLSQYFYYLGFKDTDFSKIKEEFLKEFDKKRLELNKELIFEFTKENNRSKYFNEESLFSPIKDGKDIIKKYILFLNLSSRILFKYNSDFAVTLIDVIEKKSYLFFKDYENLILEISEEYEKL